MNITAIDAIVQQAEEGVPVTIYQPDGAPYLGADGTDATITVLGAESKRVRAAARENTRRLLKRRGAKSDPVAELEANRLDLCVAAVTGWAGWEEDGQPLPCTPENVRRLFRVEHILTQVENAINGHADFFGEKSRS